MIRQFLTRKYLVSSLLAFASTGSLVMALTVPVTPAHAIVVFDPSNYAQNVLTAARTLQQINQQIQSLQNEAAMLTNLQKHLSKIDFPELQQLTEKFRQIERLMAQAQGVDFKVDQVDDQFRKLFRTNFDTALRSDQRVMGARNQFETAMAAFRQTMTVQAQVVGNVQEDAKALTALVARSQGAEGGLQAQQATNQLLALTAKQQFQIQTLMAAQYRAEAIEQARRVQAEAEARTATKQFLGSGKAYTPD